MHIERALVERLGDVGRKLHTARSRNDQVSTDLRLWVREAIDQIDGRLRRAAAGLRRPGRDATTIASCRPTPTCSGPSRCWPRTTGWAIAKNSSAIAAGWPVAARGPTCCSLGAAAVAGTSLPIDRADRRPAARLRRRGRQQSSTLSSDRDFVLEFAFCLSLIAEHLSTWAEEWILWSTSEFGFLELPQGFCTGSSIMPQKVNPDVLELVRGKTARVDRQPDRAVGADQGIAAGLQPRPARRQRAAVRFVRHGRRLPRGGRAAGGRRRAEPRRRLPSGSIAGISTPRR